MSSFTPEQLSELRQMLADFFEQMGTPPAPTPIPLPVFDKRFGPLDKYGSHTIDGLEKRYFTLDGWDAATTMQQKANIAAQLGLTPEGKFTTTGPTPVGFVDGQLANRFHYPLFGAATTNGLGATVYPLDDGPNSGFGHWRFARVRVRARGYDAIMKALQ